VLLPIIDPVEKGTAMSNLKTYLTIALITAAALLGGQYLVHAADQSAKSGSFVISSSTATTNVTDLWVVDQTSRTVYLCRASGSSGTAPGCTKGTQLP
jgi:hypothetical protein